MAGTFVPRTAVLVGGSQAVEVALSGSSHASQVIDFVFGGICLAALAFLRHPPTHTDHTS
jgi:hypothetical protein